MRVGFTGSRKGMTVSQKRTLRNALVALSPQFFHHGDCVGADAEARDIADSLKIRIISHPSTIESLRAYTDAEEVREPKPPLDRNQDIVIEGDILIAAPETVIELRRSGTWSTIRLADNQYRPVILLRPGDE